MTIVDVILTIVLNLLPIIIVILPYPFIRKKLIGKIYFRVMLGVMVFYMIYWVLPIIFQFQNPPIELELQIGEEGNLALGIGYIIAHIGSLFSLFAYYPLVTLPFIFFLAPFISVLIAWNKIRKEKGEKKEVLQGVTYHLIDSPYKKVKNELFKGDWSREWQIMKLLIVLLPISLYIMQVILKISQLEAVSITEGETALGWFIEILFAYLATFILSLELLFSSQIALKGRYFGENVRRQTYKSLYTVGTPISILSILLFIVEDINSFPVVVYFFSYFIMASFIFILFLKIFEPISLLIFIKIIDWWKQRKLKQKKTDFKNFYYGIVFGCLSVLIFFVLDALVFLNLFQIFFQNEAFAQNIVDSANLAVSGSVYLFQGMAFDGMNIFNFIALVATSLMIASITMKYGLKFIRNISLGLTTYIFTIFGLSIVFILFGLHPLINFGPETYWITGQSSYTTIFGFNFFTLRTATLDANLTGVLGILAIPYVNTQYIFNIIIWSLIFFYRGKSFSAKSLKIDEKHIERTIFSSISDFLSYDDYREPKMPYLISKEFTSIDYLYDEREEIMTILNSLETPRLMEQIKPVDENEKQRFYFTLKYLYNKGLIDILRPEFSYTFELVEKQGLFVIYGDGRDIFSYQFAEDMAQDPALISGMFSAITSFVKETTKSEDLLKKIDHGDITILIEYGKYIFCALFVKGNETAEIRARLKEFVETFETKYSEILVDWSGALIHFKEDHKLVEEIFKEV
ncbi:MAG: hypothetical protein ACFE8J_14775 [Candidatus Heimdallarchaeota archaeon]